MAADRALTKDNQAARQDVGTFDRDRNRHLLIGTREEIRRSHANALARGDVHAVVDHLAGAFSDVILRDGRNHRGLFAEIHGMRGEAARCVHHIEIAAHAAERFLHAFELADGGAELAAHSGIGAGAAHRNFRHPHVRRWQRNRPSGGQTLHQHAPAVADLRAPADHPVNRNEDVLAGVRAVLEHRVEWPMTTSYVDARMRSGDQRASDAGFVLRAQKVIRIQRAECKAKHRRDRSKCDVAFVPRDAKAERLTTLEVALADNADVGDRCGIRARVRTRQREARNLDTARETRQVMVFLFLGAVVHQQFCRSKRIRHHHRDGGRRAACGQIHDDLRVGVR